MSCPASSSQRSSTIAPTDASHDAAVLAAALDPIITIDFSGIIRSASDSVERVFGWKPSELLGRNVSILMPEPHRSAHDGYLARYRATGQTNILNRPRRFDAVRKDGSVFPIELSVSRADIPGENSPLFVGIIRDLSEREGFDSSAGGENLRLHELLAEQTAALQSAQLRLRMADRMASIGTLAAGLGHDMNNVLLPIRAHLNALAADDRLLTHASRVRHVLKVRKSIDYLQQLADGLHFLAMDPDREGDAGSSTDLHTWWSQTGALLSKAVPKHVRVIASIPPGVPEVAVAAHKLTQAVLNLIVNAGEAIDPPKEQRRRQGLVRLRVKASDDNRWVEISVADNGRGMTEEVRRRAFEMFFTTKVRGLGTGLGLPLVRRVVDEAGGTVRLESELGVGTTVALTIPAVLKPMSARTGRRTAVVSIANRRAADLVLALLESAGAQARVSDDPADASVWIVDPAGADTDRARAWRERTPVGRLVLFGEPRDAADLWRSLASDRITNTDDFEAIRAGVARALAD